MRAIKILLAWCVAALACIIVLAILTTDGGAIGKAGLATVVAVFGYAIIKLLWPAPKSAIGHPQDADHVDLPGSQPRPLWATPLPVGTTTARSEAYYATGYRGFAPPRGAFPEYLIEYADANGEVSERDIYVVSVSGDGEMVEAWCFLRHEMRTFRSSRVLQATHLTTGRRILNIGRHYLNR